MGTESLSGYIILHASTVCEFVNMPNEEISADTKAPVTIERGGAFNSVESGTFSIRCEPRSPTRADKCHCLQPEQNTHNESGDVINRQLCLLSGLPSSMSSKILTLVVG